MKFLPENKNKQILLAVVLVISLGGIVYINFFMNKQSDLPPSPVSPPAGSQKGSPVSDSPPAVSSEISVKRAKPGLLPYGSAIDMGLFATEKFKALKAAPMLVVRPEELGKSDLFTK